MGATTNGTSMSSPQIFRPPLFFYAGKYGKQGMTFCSATPRDTKNLVYFSVILSTQDLHVYMVSANSRTEEDKII